MCWKKASICTILCDIFSLKTSSTISISAGKLLHLTEAGQDQVHFKFAYVIKEVQITYRLFLVNCYLLHVLLNYAQPASNVGGLVIHLTGLNWLDST